MGGSRTIAVTNTLDNLAYLLPHIAYFAPQDAASNTLTHNVQFLALYLKTISASKSKRLYTVHCHFLDEIIVTSIAIKEEVPDVF